MTIKQSLSIVIPVFNEEEVIENTLETLNEFMITTMHDLISDFEFIVVNNGSMDNTLGILISLKKSIYKNLKIIDLTKNFGCQASVTCGIENISKNLCLVIDADLQVELSKIREMVLKIDDNTDLVLGIMSSRKEDSFFKKHTSDFFYSISGIFGIKNFKNHSYFKVFKKSIADNLKKYKELHRLDRFLIMELTSKIKTVNYKRVSRKGGTSKMNFKYLFNLATNAITSHSIVPIRLIYLIGLIMIFISLILIVLNFSREEILFEIIFLNTGIILFSLGIIGEYVFRAFIESKSRPLYLIRNIY